MTIEVKDHDFEIIHLIPSLQESISLITKKKGFESIDDYVIQLVKDDSKSKSEGSQWVVNVGECISKYLENLKILLPEVKESKEKEGKDKEKEEDDDDECNLFQIYRIKMK